MFHARSRAWTPRAPSRLSKAVRTSEPIPDMLPTGPRTVCGSPLPPFPAVPSHLQARLVELWWLERYSCSISLTLERSGTPARERYTRPGGNAPSGVCLASRGEGLADGVLLAGQHWTFPDPRSTSLDRKHHSTGGPTSSQWRLAPSSPSASDRQRESERGTALRECLMSCCSPLGGDSLCRDYAQDR